MWSNGLISIFISVLWSLVNNTEMLVYVQNLEIHLEKGCHQRQISTVSEDHKENEGLIQGYVEQITKRIQTLTEKWHILS